MKPYGKGYAESGGQFREVSYAVQSYKRGLLQVMQQMQRKRRRGRKVKLELWKPQNAGKPQVLQSWGRMLCHVLKR
jgi:hypothetical protein